jgi:hypothetical protein
MVYSFALQISVLTNLTQIRIKVWIADRNEEAGQAYVQQLNSESGGARVACSFASFYCLDAFIKRDTENKFYM